GQAAGVDDYVSRFYKSSFFQDRMLVIDDSVHALFFAVVESAYTPAQAELVDQAFLLGEDIQWRFGPIARKDKGRIAGLGHTDDGIRVGVPGQLTGIVTDGVAEERRRVRLRHQVVFAVIRVFGLFNFEDDLAHGLDDEGRMLTGGRFGAQHHGVCAFEDGVGDVGYLAAVGLNAVDHAFHHLGGDDHGFRAVDTFPDDLALGHGDLLDGQFHAEVAAGYHDGIGGVDDIAQIVHRGRHFDLGDDLGLAFPFGKPAFEIDDIFYFPNEGKRYPVQFLLDDEIQVDNIFFGHGG